MTRELKGIHVLMIGVGAFAVIITANLSMLFAATGSFPGLVVKNSYVASQGWNARTAEQQALGWTPEVTYFDGVIEVSVLNSDGALTDAGDLVVTIGRPATDTQDQIFSAKGLSPHRFSTQLAPGKWQVRIHSVGQNAFRTTASLFIPELN